MKPEYEVGDAVWIFAGDMDENGVAILSPGRVIHAFECDYRAFVQYVVLLDDPDFINCEVRDRHTMTSDPTIMPIFTQRKAPSRPTRQPPMPIQ